MTKVVVLGHGGYADGVKKNLAMLLGDIEDFYYIDFNIGEGIDDLKIKMHQVLTNFNSNDILFTCDLAGGTPFREACLYAVDHPGVVVISGINTAGYSELVHSLELKPSELAEMASEASKASILIFPQDSSL